jgi:hypothetical protein
VVVAVELVGIVVLKASSEFVEALQQLGDGLVGELGGQGNKRRRWFPRHGGYSGLSRGVITALGGGVKDVLS